MLFVKILIADSFLQLAETPDTSQHSEYASPLASLLSGASEVRGLPAVVPKSSQEYPENLNKLSSRSSAGGGALGGGAFPKSSRTKPDGASPNQLFKHDPAKVCRASLTFGD